MSFSNDLTMILWKSFMPLRGKIRNTVSRDFFSLQYYPPLFFEHFDANAEFEKWAAVEVSDFEPDDIDFDHLDLEGGMYAVFDYKGNASDAAETFRYIIGTWIPSSDFDLDDRPHFEILGERYRNNDPDSEEEIWIPVRKKKT